MATLTYSRKALSDIEKLTQFLAEQSSAAASETFSLLSEAIAILAEHPLIGRPVEQGLRELVISRGRTGYVALYRFREVDDAVLILAIRHQREAGFWQRHER